MKSKKKMLLALGAMSAAAIGAGATSTFAWYTVNASLSIVTATQENVKTAASDLSVGEYKVVFSITDNNATNGIDLTDKNGGCWVVQNDVYVAATPKYATYGSLSITAKVYSAWDGAGGAEDVEATDAQMLSLREMTKNFQVVASSRARIATTDPSTGFATAFTAINNTLNGVVSFAANAGDSSKTDVKLNINSAGATTTATVYYSISGFKSEANKAAASSQNDVPTAGAAVASSDKDASVTPMGHIEIQNRAD